jgi:hypothetical protein
MQQVEAHQTFGRSDEGVFPGAGGPAQQPLGFFAGGVPDFAQLRHNLSKIGIAPGSQYLFDFLGLGDDAQERDIEDELSGELDLQEPREA